MGRQRMYTSMEDMTPSIYQNTLLEHLTRMHYIVPFLVYTPVTAFFAYRALLVNKMPAWHFLWMLPMVTVFWSWLEYVLHKHFLHRKADGSATIEMVNKIHEAHHEYPNDSYRLAVHFWVTFLGAFVFYGLCRLIFGPLLADAVFASLVFYYLVYEFAHISAHKINSNNPILNKIKKHHLKHHFQDEQRGFGFTSGIWDALFGTDFIQKK